MQELSEGGGGAEKLGGALHKIAAKIGGAQSKISHLTEEAGALSFATLFLT